MFLCLFYEAVSVSGYIASTKSFWAVYCL